MSPWCVPALSLTVTWQQLQHSADQQDRSEKNETVILWLLLHGGNQASTENLPLAPARPECWFALIGAQLRDGGRKTERERGTRGEGKKQGRGRKENETRASTFWQDFIWLEGWGEANGGGGGAHWGSTLQTCNCMSAQLRLAVVISVHINCAFSLVSSVEHQTVLLEWMYASKQKFWKEKNVRAWSRHLHSFITQMTAPRAVCCSVKDDALNQLYLVWLR